MSPFPVTLPVLVLLAGLLVPAAGPGDREEGSAAGPRTELAEALGVLHEWDARRARAWARGDVLALRSLYVPGSGAARADVRLLEEYAARGLVVQELVTQVFSVRLLGRTPTTLRLSVFDRVAGGEMVRAGRRLTVPSSRPVTRTVAFRLVEDGWRVASVSGSGRDPRGARR